jgi:hypothetical protein
MNSGEMREHGQKLLLALYTQNDWMIRTVDRVRFIDRNTVRRRIVRHFTLPHHSAAQPIVEVGGNLRCLLPVFTLEKGKFISCDLRDAGNRRVALRPLADRWDLTVAALLALLSEADHDVESDRELKRRVEILVRSTYHDSPKALGDLLEYRGQIESDAPELAKLLATSEFEKLAGYLAKNYLVFADVALDGPEATHMISYVVDQRFVDRATDFKEADMEVPRRSARLQRLLGLVPHVYLHPWSISGAGSSHLEIEAPEGVDFGERDLRLPRLKTLRHPGTSSRYARFLAPRTAASGEGFVKLNVHPGSGVMRTAGPAVGMLFTALVVIVAASSVRASAAATLLLILPGMTSFIAARPGEHPYVSRVVRGVRYTTLMPIPLSALAAAALIAGWPVCWLWLIAAISTIPVLILAIGARRLRVRPAYNEFVMSDLTRIA